MSGDLATTATSAKALAMSRGVVVPGALIALAVAAVTGLGLSRPAATDSPDDPCAPAISLFCRFVPIAPGLDGDVDLTKQLPSATPSAPDTESAQPGLV